MTPGEAVAVAALVVALAGSALLVDPAAHASFDAPKRLAALAGTSIAAVAAFAFARRARGFRETWRAIPLAARVAVVAAAVALAWSAVSALLSPRRPASLDALRAMTLYVLLLPLGASNAVDRGKNVLVTAFLGSTAANAALSILQSRGVRIFRLETFGTRNETGALAGNVGYLALAVAIAGVLSIGIALTAHRKLLRYLAAGAVLLLLAALAVNRNVTAIASVVAGAIALAVGLWGRRSLVRLGAVALLLGGTVFAVEPLRHRATEAISAARAGDWDRLTTYRTGAWAAALEMTRERPVPGWGPGTYASEFVPHRLTAEIRARRRYVNPLVTSSYSEAHCDYLQAFAEGGFPGGLSVIVGVGALLLAVGRRARPGYPSRAEPSRAEAAILFGVLVAGAVAALTWFPLQRPISATPLLLAAGRGWRLAADWPSR
jgi:O-antigen ligase